MATINLNHLFYFYEVARRGSFTRASRDLLVAQSALSVQIKTLENSLGTPLFDRDGAVSSSPKRGSGPIPRPSASSATSTSSSRT